MGARYYDTSLARFISPDTIIGDVGNTQAMNSYAYAYDSPLSYADPSGHQPVGIGQQYQLESGPFSISLTVARGVWARAGRNACEGARSDLFRVLWVGELQRDLPFDSAAPAGAGLHCPRPSRCLAPWR